MLAAAMVALNIVSNEKKVGLYRTPVSSKTSFNLLDLIATRHFPIHIHAPHHVVDDLIVQKVVSDDCVCNH